VFDEVDEHPSLHLVIIPHVSPIGMNCVLECIVALKCDIMLVSLGYDYVYKSDVMKKVF